MMYDHDKTVAGMRREAEDKTRAQQMGMAHAAGAYHTAQPSTQAMNESIGRIEQALDRQEGKINDISGSLLGPGPSGAPSMPVPPPGLLGRLEHAALRADRITNALATLGDLLG